MKYFKGMLRIGEDTLMNQLGNRGEMRRNRR